MMEPGDREASVNTVVEVMEVMEAQRSQVLNLERVKALDTWLNITHTKLTQVNGQRKYGGPPEVWEGPVPGAHCEVFISQIPRDAYEDLLIPLFSSVGPLWEFRLMMNFSGQNRGFAYAKYSSSSVAAEAIRLLHGHMLQPGSHISVFHSIEKRHLCIGELPAATKQENLLQVLRMLAEGVERVSLKAGPGIEGACAIVGFSSHYTASMAKKMLEEAFKKEFSLSVSVKWQSTVKPSRDELLPPKKPLKTPLASPLKPPRHILNSPQPSAPPPPRLASPPVDPPGFGRAVGGPAAPPHPPPPRHSASAGHRLSAPSPVMLLHKACEAMGVGQPRYDVRYVCTGPDGFIYFTFTVRVPGIPLPFTGLVSILPGATAATMMEEGRQAAAQQVLHRVHNVTSR